MRSEFDDAAWEITYSDDDPGITVVQRPIDVVDCEQLAPDSILGSRIIEWRLSEELDPDGFAEIEPYLD
jgi:hypothetical protein